MNKLKKLPTKELLSAREQSPTVITARTNNYPRSITSRSMKRKFTISGFHSASRIANLVKRHPSDERNISMLS